jgi:hypothetical protein
MKATTLFATVIGTVAVGATLAGCTPVLNPDSVANAASISNATQSNNDAPINNDASINNNPQVNNSSVNLPSYPDSGSLIRNRGPIQFQPGATSTVVYGYLPYQNIDRYTFNAAAGQPATIAIGSPDRAVQLTLIDPDGFPMVRAQAGSTYWSGTLPTSGTYRVEAVDSNGASSYNMSLNIQPSYNPPTPPIPPTPPTPQVRYQGPIQFQPGATSTVVRNYLPYQDIDRYTFNATGGQSANVSIYSPGRDVLLTIVDPNGNPIVRYQSGASYWSGILPASGNYTVDAVAAQGAAPYSLQLGVQPFRRLL